jgi:hypothetical protein
MVVGSLIQELEGSKRRLLTIAEKRNLTWAARLKVREFGQLLRGIVERQFAPRI